VTTLAANTQASAFATTPASTPRCSVEIEDVDDEDEDSQGIRPVNDESDQSDDEGGKNAERAVSVIRVNDSDEEQVGEETDKAKCGMIPVL
jgi:hypothetical protein